MDSSLFSVIFDNSALNDPSLVNDTRKNHLSVHYCFSIFYQLDPPFAVVFSFLYPTKDRYAARFV